MIIYKHKVLKKQNFIKNNKERKWKNAKRTDCDIVSDRRTREDV